MNVERAVQILRAGGVVAFPTETVYGLGGDATNPAAIARIFAAKGRPATNPLIVHVADIYAARRYATEWPETAQKLAEKFWPGPLTLVLPKSPAIVSGVTAGLHAVGLRVPQHPMALALLAAFDGPVAAPSANRSNRISPTTAQHVKDELGNAIDGVLDGGPCGVGIESTVLDLSTGTPALLRPGGVSREDIEAVIGPVTLGGAADARPAISPGQHPVHYAPLTPAWRVDDTARFASLLMRASSGAILLKTTDIGSVGVLPGVVFYLPAEPAAYAQQFYSTLRHLDAKGLANIYIELPPQDERWLAIRDRIVRATRALE